MENKLISIVLPVYNGEKFLRDSIDSIINQTYKNWELIIVNDCSTDNSLKIAQEYEKLDERIKVISNEINKKLPASLNIGFKEAKGEYLTWTSDDNKYKSRALERMCEYLEKNEKFTMVCADYEILTEGKTKCKSVKCKFSEMLVSNGVGACFLYRRSVLNKIGGYSEDLFLVEDYDYWLKIMKVGKIGEIKENLYTYRRHSASLSETRKIEIPKIALKLQADFIKNLEPTNEEIRFFKKAFEILKAININKNINQEDILFLQTNKNLSYRIIKNFYNATRDEIYIKAIEKLGFLYKIKMMFKKKHNYKIKDINVTNINNPTNL